MLALGLAAELHAGDWDSGKALPAKNYELDPLPDSEFNFYIPGWLPWSELGIGIRGIDAHASVGGDVLLKNLDSAILAGVEGRRGKLGFILEANYLKAGLSANTPGQLLTTAALGYEQIIAEATGTYRIYEDDRAWIEFLAGARYWYVSSSLGLQANPAGVAAVSDDISEAIVSTTSKAVKAELDRRIANIIANLPSPTGPARPGTLKDSERRVLNGIDHGSGAILGRVRNGIGSNESGLAENFARQGPVRELVRQYVRAKFEAELEDRRAATSNTVRNARRNARQRAKTRLAQAEQKLARGIRSRLTRGINRFPVEGSQGWVDPFVGLRGKVLLTDDLYFVARADYGGFGVNSDSTFELFGAIGTRLRENTLLEVGIKHMGVDYTTGGITFDSTFTGPFSGVVIQF